MTTNRERAAERIRKELNPTPGETGYWLVKGEDPNPDMSGPHIEPVLGHFKGTFEEVLALALWLPRFFEWGAGGSIERFTIYTPSTYKAQVDEQDRIAALAKLTDREKELLFPKPPLPPSPFSLFSSKAKP